MDHELIEEHPGYSPLITTLTGLLTTPPPFIYITDSSTPRRTSAVTKATLQAFSSTATEIYRYAFVNAVSCFTPRLLYDAIINALAEWTPQWENACENWSFDGQGGGARWDADFTAFSQGLRLLGDQLEPKGKKKQSEVAPRIIIAIERAERLKDNYPELLVPLTRLAELSRMEVSLILLSEIRWEDIKPPLGASPDPFFVDVEPLDKTAIIRHLQQQYKAIASTSNSSQYSPSLLPLYTHFASILFSTCYLFTHDPDELAYISAARWPGFVQPLLDERQEAQDHLMDTDTGTQPVLPNEDTRMILTRLFTPSLTRALESLLPRLTHAREWASDNAPPVNLFSMPPGQMSLVSKAGQKPSGDDYNMAEILSLPRMTRYILVASFLASTNPAKTDLRMFGRGLDEKKRKRKGGSPRKAKSGATSAPVKLPQRLSGPTPAPLGRILSILGILLEEYDVESRPPAPQYTLAGEETEAEISRVAIYASFISLTKARLLHETSASNEVGVGMMIKCGVGYEVALGLAKSLGIPLGDLMWDDT